MTRTLLQYNTIPQPHQLKTTQYQIISHHHTTSNQYHTSSHLITQHHKTSHKTYMAQHTTPPYHATRTLLQYHTTTQPYQLNILQYQIISHHTTIPYLSNIKPHHNSRHIITPYHTIISIHDTAYHTIIPHHQYLLHLAIFALR